MDIGLSDDCFTLDSVDTSSTEPPISVSDSSTTSEFVGYYTDLVLVSEAISLLLYLKSEINVFENVMVSESSTVDLPLKNSEVDSTVTSEFLGYYPDVVNITESVTVVLAGFPGIFPVENIVTSEATEVDIINPFNPQVSDTVITNDHPDLTVDHGRNISLTESVSTSERLTVAKVSITTTDEKIYIKDRPSDTTFVSTDTLENGFIRIRKI